MSRSIQPVLDMLARAPLQLEELARLVPADRWAWEPADWEAIPGEQFSAVGQVCHLRDIETDGYHVRVRRLLEERDPDLVSVDGYQLARERAYAKEDPQRALAGFRSAAGDARDAGAGH